MTSEIKKWILMVKISTYEVVYTSFRGQMLVEMINYDLDLHCSNEHKSIMG
jgi:hypothetical protein